MQYKHFSMLIFINCRNRFESSSDTDSIRYSCTRVLQIRKFYEGYHLSIKLEFKYCTDCLDLDFNTALTVSNPLTSHPLVFLFYKSHP